MGTAVARSRAAAIPTARGRSGLVQGIEALPGICHLRGVATGGEGEKPRERLFRVRRFVELLLDDAEQVRNPRVTGIRRAPLLQDLLRLRPLARLGQRFR